MRGRVLISGGGIGGLAAGIALRQHGVDVTLLERQPGWRTLGSGIFVNSNGLACLKRLGVWEAAKASGFGAAEDVMVVLDDAGRELTRVSYPRLAGPDVPAILGIRRAELHRILAERAADVGVDIRFNAAVTGYTDAPGRPLVAHLADGTTVEGAVLLGGDGIRSALRDILFPGHDPVFTGFGTWRSTHKRPPELVHKTMMMGTGKRLGIMPIEQDQLYVFATTNEPEKPAYDPATIHLVMRDKLREFAGPATRFLDDITAPEQVIYTAVEEIHLPLPWSKGRVLLIGDAAHASTPYMAQGGAMALEDAVVLGDMLAGAEDGDLTATLSAFGARRFDRCRYVQDESRKVGQLGGLENPESVKLRNANIPRVLQASTDAFYARIAEAI